MRILHITSASDWDPSRTTYEPASLATDGFIHFSLPEQVAGVANAFYRGRADLVLLVVDPDRLTSPLRFEVPVDEAGAPEFPHLYGPLNTDAVIDVLPFEETDVGFRLPSELEGLRD